MTWITTVDEKKAEGKVQGIYEAFNIHVSFVPSIISVFSIKPRSLEATFNLFKLFLYGPSPLSRAHVSSNSFDVIGAKNFGFKVC